MRLMHGLRLLLANRLAISSCNTRKASAIEEQAAFWTTGGGSRTGQGGEPGERRRKRWRFYASLWREATAKEGEGTATAIGTKGRWGLCFGSRPVGTG